MPRGGVSQLFEVNEIGSRGTQNSSNGFLRFSAPGSHQLALLLEIARHSSSTCSFGFFRMISEDGCAGVQPSTVDPAACSGLNSSARRLHGGNTGSNPVGDATLRQTRCSGI